jgi:hypothetical protein
MRFSRISFAVFSALAVPPALADECWICDDVVELNAAYAECYLANYTLLMESFEAKGVERHQVDFAGCDNSAGTSGTRGGLLQMGGLQTPNAVANKSVYTLSRASAICLKTLIVDAEGALDPSVVFRLAEQCPDE